MAGTPPEHEPSSRTQRAGERLAGEAERARTPRTPALALASVWAVVAVVVALVVALVFVVYFALG
jgi:cobalamin biosynthesis Mg chelatase CobN